MSTHSAKPTNLKEVFFSHAALGKIQGNPTYEDIQKLYRQCKANAKSVPSVLGGGANGHLGLIISALRAHTDALGRNTVEMDIHEKLLLITK